MLSIITITKDDHQGLTRTIASTLHLRASFKDIEQLVIDGSSERIQAKNRALCDGEQNLLYYKRDPNGISDAFNFGIEKSHFNWLWFLNGGDSVFDGLDLNVFVGLLGSIQADLVIFQIKLMQSGRAVSFPSISLCFPPVKPWIPHPATLVRRSVVERYGHFDCKYQIAMDYDLWLRLYEKEVVVNLISLPITLYDENGLSSLNIPKVSGEGRKIIKQHWADLMHGWLQLGKSIINQYRIFNYRARK